MGGAGSWGHGLFLNLCEVSYWVLGELLVEGGSSGVVDVVPTATRGAASTQY